MRKSVHSDAASLLRSLLREARQKAELRQQDVADRLGRPQSFVAKYERGERQLDVIEFIEIARVLGSDPVRMLKIVVKSQETSRKP
ncbi:helix-turn-helix domain-containing protein [Bauldia litoralis]|uniref:helix-turn-helix domain-containing protein n=1 Tax=Bauldia litoralis TaxID=665467 RepID=UPI0032647702